MLYRVTKLIDPAPADAQVAKAAVERQARAASTQQYEAYLASLRSRAKITVNAENLEKK